MFQKFSSHSEKKSAQGVTNVTEVTFLKIKTIFLKKNY